MNLPIGIVALVISVEPLIDMGRTALNVSGSMTAGLISSKWLGELDQDTYNQDDTKLVKLLHNEKDANIQLLASFYSVPFIDFILRIITLSILLVALLTLPQSHNKIHQRVLLLSYSPKCLIELAFLKDSFTFPNWNIMKSNQLFFFI